MNADKLAAQKQWNANPCGTGDHLSELDYGSLEFFDEVRRSRYEDSDPWIKRTIDYSVARGGKVLEIGHGMGTDLMEFARNGAEVYGVDITQEHHRLASRNFELHGFPCTLKLCDSAAIDFPSEFFDVVYSMGVLHHTPDTVRCISEAYRVLKPGGQLILSMYHTYSAFHLFSMILYSGVLKGNLKRLGYRGVMSTLERGADGIEIKPLVKTYGKRQLTHILEDFSRVEFKIAHLDRSHFSSFGRLVPGALVRWMEPRWGWYIVAFATK